MGSESEEQEALPVHSEPSTVITYSVAIGGVSLVKSTL